MTDLKSMKLSEQETKESYSNPSTVVTDAPKYPYGLKINLDDDSLKKLGYNMLPSVGTVLHLWAKVEVCAVSEYETQGSGSKKDMSLQITDLGLDKMSSADGAEKKIYG